MAEQDSDPRATVRVRFKTTKLSREEMAAIQDATLPVPEEPPKAPVTPKDPPPKTT